MMRGMEPEDDSVHGGGAWKVAYADFITALMALFIVLWLLNSTKEVREAVSGYFRDPKGQMAQKGSGQAGSGEGVAVNRDSVGELRSKLEQSMRQIAGFDQFSQYVQFSVTGEGLRIELMEKNDGMFFETGNAKPTAAGEELFAALGSQLSALPNSVAIEGHTDAKPFRGGDDGSYGNWELSFDRANMARRVMLAHGLKPGQIWEIRGYADRQPLKGDDPFSSRNRRISVIVRY
jgi:chemotaxis protein MotB